MAEGGLVEIPARRGKAARVAAGSELLVVNTHGSQVVDTWAFAAGDMAEYMSMQATRATGMKMCPGPGDSYYSNRRRAMLTVLEDTSPGRHDTLIAACDRERYVLLGHEGYHDNCSDNMHAGLAELGLAAAFTPSPLNLFMNIPWTEDGDLSYEAPLSRPGDRVRFRAEMDLVAVFSACPQDILPINGEARQPVEAHFAVA